MAEWRRRRVFPTLGVLAALALFCALPAVAVGQTTDQGAGQDIDTGDGDGGSGDISGDQNAEQDVGAGGQGILQQCQALRDCNQQAINQKVTNVTEQHRNVTQAAPSGDAPSGDAPSGDGPGVQAAQPVVQHVAAPRPAAVRQVPLAQTGFDAWILLALGGASVLAGGGLMARRRGLSVFPGRSG